MSTRPALRTIRHAAWGAVALLGALVLATGAGWLLTDGPGRSTTGRVAEDAGPGIGGPFEMVDHRGRSVTERDFAGRPMLVFFGFTSCPDACPTTLADMSRWLEALGPDASRLSALFVTVDPERDTPEQMANYLGAFDSRIVGLTGTAAQVEAMGRAWRVHRSKVPTAEGYTMDHTSFVYLMDARGSFAGTINAMNQGEETAVAKLRGLLERRA